MLKTSWPMRICGECEGLMWRRPSLSQSKRQLPTVFDFSLVFNSFVSIIFKEQHCARRHADEYDQLGYISVESDARAVCVMGYLWFFLFHPSVVQLTLAYAHNDFALAQWAQAMNSSLASFFSRRSDNYLNVWSPRESFFCSRFRNGTFDCPSNKLNVFSDNYVEVKSEKSPAVCLILLCFGRATHGTIASMAQTCCAPSTRRSSL